VERTRKAESSIARSMRHPVLDANDFSGIQFIGEGSCEQGDVSQDGLHVDHPFMMHVQAPNTNIGLYAGVGVAEAKMVFT
jgi:hypothetical protein